MLQTRARELYARAVAAPMDDNVNAKIRDFLYRIWNEVRGLRLDYDKIGVFSQRDRAKGWVHSVQWLEFVYASEIDALSGHNDSVLTNMFKNALYRKESAIMNQMLHQQQREMRGEGDQNRVHGGKQVLEFHDFIELLGNLAVQIAERNGGTSIAEMNRFQEGTKTFAIFRLAEQTRNYRHWHAPAVDDFTLPPHSMPIDIKEILKDPSQREFDFLDHYWYKQLAYDMGMPVVSEVLEHHMGLIELYEYLKSSPMIGPFGTVENPVIIPSLSDIRQVCCTGGTGDNEHDAMFFHMREGFLYRCGECDQIFMLVRVTYGNSWVDESYKDHKEIFAKDPDVDDVFDIKLLERGHRSWNSSDMLRWEMGAQALNAVPTPEDATEMKMPVIREVHVRGLAFPYQFTEDDVRRVFSRYGDVSHVALLAQDAAAVTFFSLGNTMAAWQDLDGRGLSGLEGAFLVVACPELETEMGVLAQAMDSKDNRYLAMQTSDFTTGGKKFTCRLEIGIENEKEFRVGSRVIQIARRIWEELPTFRDHGGKTRLRGKGHESEEPLALCISCRDVKDFGQAVEFAEAEMRKVHEAYVAFRKEAAEAAGVAFVAPELPACRAMCDHVHTVAPGLASLGSGTKSKTSIMGGARESAANQAPLGTGGGGSFGGNVSKRSISGGGDDRGSAGSNRDSWGQGDPQSSSGSPPLQRGVRPSTAPEEDEILRMIEGRNEARKSGDYKRADEIRDYLKQVGVVLMDDKGARGNKRGNEVTKWRYWNP
eukprot:g1954.t1